MEEKTNKVKIITDSCCSLSEEYLKSLNVDYLQTTFMIDDIMYNGFDEFKDSDEVFYESIKTAKNISTGCVNNQTFYEMFEKTLNEGYDVVFIGLSGGLSSSYSNACMAAEEINSKYGKRVWVADSLIGGQGLGKMVEVGAALAKEGKTAEEIFEKLDKNALKVIPLFVPGDLMFLTKLGRLNKIVAGIGSLLKIAPIITTNDEGKLKILSKTIGRKKALASIKEYILKNADLEKEENIFVGHTNQPEEAEELAQFIRENTKNKNVVVSYIDRTMGCHCGPNTVAIFVSGK